MLRVFKSILPVIFGLLSVSAAMAQKVTFEARVPSAVASGDVFRIEFALNANPENFTAPDMAGFDILAGPTSSRSQNISIVNGSMTKETSHTITYVLNAKEPGIYSIGAAQAIVDGKTYSTRPISIEVIEQGTAGGAQSQGSSSQQGSSSGQQQQQGQAASGSLAPDDILVRVIVDKTNVFKGQPIKATIKAYYRVSIAGGEDFKYPAFNGFWTQELPESNARQQRETYNNKLYDTEIIREYLLYPQQSGTLYIEQFDVTIVAQLVTQTRSQSIFDDFFGGGQQVQHVRKKVSSAPVKITVKDLPAGAPASFNGAVGQFTMEAKLPSASIPANSAATYTVKISGTGNLPLVQSPKLTLPSSFEQYNIKTTESLNNTGAGTSGYRQFEYPFIARAEGIYYLEPVQFTYFNPAQARYVTLSSEGLEITVQPDSTSAGISGGGGIVSGLTKEDLKILGQDIRFIKIGSAGLMSVDSVLMGSTFYFVVILVLAVAFVAALIYLQKRIREMRNTALVKGKRANKVALQRFRTAERYMKEDNQRMFYDETLRALWGYMSDKLNIPVANLTKENVRTELLKRNVQPETAERFIEIISECEYAQYSPAGSGQMHEVYRNAVETISKLESTIKK